MLNHLRLSIEALEHAEAQIQNPASVCAPIRAALLETVSGGVSEILASMRDLEEFDTAPSHTELNTASSHTQYPDYRVTRSGSTFT